jgi:hypothetical protein
MTDKSSRTVKRTFEEKSQAGFHVPPETGDGNSLVPTWVTAAAIGAAMGALV